MSSFPDHLWNGLGMKLGDVVHMQTVHLHLPPVDIFLGQPQFHPGTLPHPLSGDDCKKR